MKQPKPSAAGSCGVNRRAFLRGAAALTVAAASGSLAQPGRPRLALSATEPLQPFTLTVKGTIIDCNVTLGQWPCRRLPLDDCEALVRALRKRRVAHAWVGSFEGILHNDIADTNRRLFETCRKHRRGFLVPFGTVNPRLPGWENDLEICATQFRMPGVRLYPSYHGYTLDDPVFAQVLRAADQHKLILQLPVMLEDERTQHPLLGTTHVDVRPLLKRLQPHEHVRVLLLNWWRGVPRTLLPALTQSGRVFLDVATVEGVAGIRNLLDAVPLSTIVFGSHTPFFYWESSMLKLVESDLSPAELEAIRFGNAQKLAGSPAAR